MTVHFNDQSKQAVFLFSSQNFLKDISNNCSPCVDPVTCIGLKRAVQTLACRLMFPQHFTFSPDSTCTWASLTRQKQETFFLFLNYQSTQPTHILLFEILIKPMQDNNIGGLFLPTVLPPSVIISVSATRRLPIIPVPISVTAILLFMNDNYYLVVFKNKKKSYTAHDLKEFLLFTPCYHLLSTVVLPLIHLTPRP